MPTRRGAVRRALPPSDGAPEDGGRGPTRRDLLRRAALGAGAALVLPSRTIRGQSRGPGRRGGTLRVAQAGSELTVGNPLLTGGDGFAPWWAFSRLLTFDDHGRPIPDLADSWAYAPDGLTLTFALNPRAFWHDGQPVTAADVLFTFDALRDPATESPLTPRIQVDGQFVAWSAPDRRTVALALPRPHAPFLAALAGIPIVPRHHLSGGRNTATDPFATAPVGCGPFRVVEWKAGESVRYEAVPDHYRGGPAADALVERRYPDQTAALDALDAGETDVAFALPDGQRRFGGRSGFRVLGYPFYAPVGLGFNFKHPILQDLRVREAIRLAIDKDALVQRMGRDPAARSDHQYAATPSLARYNDPALPPDAFDPARAGSLLDEAGWARPVAGGHRQNGDQPLSLSILTYEGFAEYRTAVWLLRGQLRAAGIQTVAEVLSYDALYERWVDPDDDPATRALTLEEYPHPSEHDPDVSHELHSAAVPPAGLNYNYVRDDELDRLLVAGRATLDAAVRAPLYHQLDARRRALAVSVPLYETTDAWIVSGRVRGIPPNTPSSRWVLRSRIGELWTTGDGE